jgi:hypothetical protein
VHACRIRVASDSFLPFIYNVHCSLQSQAARQNSYLSDTPRRRQSTGLTLEQSYSSILSDDSVASPLHARFDHSRLHMADQNHNQSQPLTGSTSNNYGTLPTGSSLGVNTSARRHERGRRMRQTAGPGFPRTSTRGSQYSPHEHPSLTIKRPISVAGLKETLKDSWGTLKRTPSTYDPPLVDLRTDEPDDTEASRINGIRVWYSSFTSIDWLHDAVSDTWSHHVLPLSHALNR